MFRTEVPSSREALGKVVVLGKGPDAITALASADTEYTNLFGRDTLTLALDLLPYKPEIARRVLKLFASKQGTVWEKPDHYPLDEEQPGRILHEEQSDGIPHHLKSRFPTKEAYEAYRIHFEEKSRRLTQQWGTRYFGSVDATPKYLLLAREYLRVTGNTNFLDETYVGSDKEKHTMYDSFLAAAEWVYTNATYGPNVNPQDGTNHERQSKPLLRFLRVNHLGIENQIMMDSKESFIFPDGTLANHAFPIADTGSQGQAYDALLFAADLLSQRDTSEKAAEKATAWRNTAAAIQQNTLNLWLDYAQYFAMGEDITGAIPTMSSNVVELLSSTIFDNLSPQQKRTYISGISRMLTSTDFLTQVGIRSRALRHISALTVDVDGKPTRFSDYHGVDSIWMEKLRWFIRGLDKQSLYTLADQMRYILLDAVNTEGSFTEFFWVTPDGQPIYNSKMHQGEDGVLNVTSLSERDQAWTISAAIATKKELEARHRPQTQPNSWQAKLEDELIASMKERGLYRSRNMRTRREIQQAQQATKQYTLAVNTAMGRKAQERLHGNWEKIDPRRIAA